MADPNGSERTARGGRVTLLWSGTLVLSVGATAILVLSDDPRLLRLGLVAALWAAFLGAFAVVRLRHRLTDGVERAAQRQRVYELELEREVAARREFELEAENEARRRAAEESGRDIEALRAELRTLREALEPLVGGDFLYERVALQAESARVRPVPEEPPRGTDDRVGGAAAEPIARAGQQRTSAGGARPVRPPGRPAVAGETPPPASRPVRTDSTAPPREPAQPAPSPSATGGPAAREGDPRSRPDLAPAVRSRPDLPRPGARPPAPGRPSGAASAEPPSSAAQRAPAGDSGQGQQDDSAAWTSQVAPGAHAEGTSVVDLIAAYGDSGDSRRRRRRGE